MLTRCFNGARLVLGHCNEGNAKPERSRSGGVVVPTARLQNQF